MLKTKELNILHSQFAARNVAIFSFFSGKIKNLARVKHLTNSTPVMVMKIVVVSMMKVLLAMKKIMRMLLQLLMMMIMQGGDADDMGKG